MTRRVQRADEDHDRRHRGRREGTPECAGPRGPARRVPRAADPSSLDRLGRRIACRSGCPSRHRPRRTPQGLRCQRRRRPSRPQSPRLFSTASQTKYGLVMRPHEDLMGEVPGGSIFGSIGGRIREQPEETGLIAAVDPTLRDREREAGHEGLGRLAARRQDAGSWTTGREPRREHGVRRWGRGWRSRRGRRWRSGRSDARDGWSPEDGDAGDGDHDDRRDGEQGLDITVHVGVPPGDAPHRSLGLAIDAVGDDVDDAIGCLTRAFAEPLVEKSFDVALLGHADRPSLTVVRASASRAARMARCA